MLLLRSLRVRHRDVGREGMRRKRKGVRVRMRVRVMRKESRLSVGLLLLLLGRRRLSIVRMRRRHCRCRLWRRGDVRQLLRLRNGRKRRVLRLGEKRLLLLLLDDDRNDGYDRRRLDDAVLLVSVLPEELQRVFDDLLRLRDDNGNGKGKRSGDNSGGFLMMVENVEQASLRLRRRHRLWRRKRREPRSVEPGVERIRRNREWKRRRRTRLLLLLLRRLGRDAEQRPQ